jgi:hypothetical protein
MKRRRLMAVRKQLEPLPIPESLERAFQAIENTAPPYFDSPADLGHADGNGARKTSR